MRENEECTLEFCDREATLTAKHSRIKVCKAHYLQDWNHKEFAPVRTRRLLPMDETGRVCTNCERYKPWSEFYKRSDSRWYQSRCKNCMIEENTQDKQERLARGIPCSKDNCNEPVLNLGLCITHYNQHYYERTNI